MVELITGDLLVRALRGELRGELAGLRSARRGAYRVVYALDEAARTVTVVAVEHRSAAYRRR